MIRKSRSFDSQQVQYDTRRQIALHTGMFGLLVVLSLGVLLIVTASVRHPVSWMVGVGTVCLLPVTYVGYRIYRLSQIVWFIKITPERLEGYDYARRKIRLPWKAIRCIDINRGELTVTSRDGRFITLPPDFTEFSAVGHLLFDEAEQRRIPIFIDGRAWESLSIYTLFPFLNDDKPAAF